MGVLTILMAQAQQHVVIAAPFLQTGHGLSDGPLADAFGHGSNLKRICA